MEHHIPRILVVEDDEDIARIQVFNLNAGGDMEARAISYGGALFHEIRTFRPDLIILDIMLPDVDGFEILKALRSMDATKDLPVIIITAKDAETDRIKGLELGADDYMVKPFSPKEMVLRVRSVLKRTSKAEEIHHPEDQHQLKIGPIELDFQKYVATVDGKQLELTRIEFKLLEFLMRHRGMVLTRERLMHDVWGYSSDSIYTRTVDTHIRRLRQKLGAFSHCIRTVRGVGYKFEIQG